MDTRGKHPSGIPPKPTRGRRLLGISMVVLGVALIAAVASYYIYAATARARLDELVYSVEERNTPSPEPPLVQTTPQGPSFLASSFVSIYPGEQLNPKYWGEPLWSGTDPYVAAALPEGYEPVEASLPQGTLSTAKRIQIPIIDVDSTVKELSILDLGDSRAYETPDNTVGHIPDTANPGETGNGWFFGHLESPIRGEGNVFQDLPKIPEHLRQGDRVFVALESEDGTYLYEVTATQVVHESQIHLYDSDDATITLVACVPRWVYDHRLLVTAELVGVKR